MALLNIHNYKFQYSFTDDEGRACILQLIPGYEANLSSPAAIAFPTATFLNKITLKRGYDNDLPIGLEITPTMELLVNLDQLEGTFDTDKNWLDVAIQIVRGRSIEKRSPFTGPWQGESIYIPNRWTLTRAGVIIFDGFQETTPEKELILEFKVMASGAFHSISKKITGQGNYIFLLPGNEIYKYLFELSYFGTFYYLESYFAGHVLMKTYGEIINDYRTAFLKYEAAYYRVSSSTMMNFKGTSNTLLASGTSGTPLLTFDGSNQNLTLGMTVTGTGIPANTIVTNLEGTTQAYISENLTSTISSEALTFQHLISNILENINFSTPTNNATYQREWNIGDNLNDLYLCVSCVIGPKLDGGFMQPVDEAHGLSKYKSLYDVFQEGISNNLLKARIDYDATNMSLNIIKVLDNFIYDNLGEPTKTISKGYGTKITIDYKMPASVKSTKLQVKDSDLTEIEIINSGSDSSDTGSNEPQIMNDISVWSADSKPNYRHLYYSDSTWYKKVHPAITFWLGMGFSYTNTEGGIASFGLTNTKDLWTKKNNPIIIERQKVQGITYTTALALNELLKNQNVKIEVETREIDILDFGERITIGSALYPNSAFLPGELKDSGIVFGCEYDVKTCWNKIQIFISGIK